MVELARLGLPEPLADRIGEEPLHHVAADRFAWRLADLEQAELIEAPALSRRSCRSNRVSVRVSAYRHASIVGSGSAVLPAARAHRLARKPAHLQGLPLVHRTKASSPRRYRPRIRRRGFAPLRATRASVSPHQRPVSAPQARRRSSVRALRRAWRTRPRGSRSSQRRPRWPRWFRPSPRHPRPRWSRLLPS